MKELVSGKVVGVCLIYINNRCTVRSEGKIFGSLNNNEDVSNRFKDIEKKQYYLKSFN